MLGKWKKPISREKKALPSEKCSSLSLPGNATMLQHLIIQSKINNVLKLEKTILVPGNLMLFDG